jgi:hypothetical protein
MKKVRVGGCKIGSVGLTVNTHILLYQKWTRICFVCCIFNHVLFSIITCHLIHNKSNMHTCEPSGGSKILPILKVPPVNFQNLPAVKKIKYKKTLIYILRSIFLEIPHLEPPRWRKTPRDTNGKGEWYPVIDLFDTFTGKQNWVMVIN